ncbi:MAG: hypothetical protein JNK26_00535 [Candidatus Doudnabacteria bacterium]|nr:hypothetical protein [Candidatus Doudnabacteria bacterium]
MKNAKRNSVHDEKASGLVLPPEIETVSFTFGRDMNKIHALVLPIKQLDISELIWHLYLPFFWLDKDHPFSIRPIDVINDPIRYEYRFGRIVGVDTSYPIDIMWWKGRWQILDGLHRLCKQVIEGKAFVNVRKVPPEWIPRITPD